MNHVPFSPCTPCWRQLGTPLLSACCAVAGSPPCPSTWWLCECVKAHQLLCCWAPAHPGSVALTASAPGSQEGKGKQTNWLPGIAGQWKGACSWQQREQRWCFQGRTTVDCLVWACLQCSVLSNLEGNMVSMRISVGKVVGENDG